MSREDRYAREREALESLLDHSEGIQISHACAVVSDPEVLSAITGTDPASRPALTNLHRWEQLARELIWITFEDTRTLFLADLEHFRETQRALRNPGTWLETATRLERRAALEAEAPEYRYYLASVWASFARTIVHRVWSFRIRLLRVEWVQYWARRPLTRIGARQATRIEGLTRFLSQHRFVRVCLQDPLRPL